MEHIKQKLEEARKQREHLRHSLAASGVNVSRLKQSVFGSEHSRLFALKDKRIWILSGMALVIASVLITWLIRPDQQSVERSYSLALPEPQQTRAAGKPAFEELKTQISGLIKRVDTLTNSISLLESSATPTDRTTDASIGAAQKPGALTLPELPVTTRAAQVIEILPPPAAGQAGIATSPTTAHRQASTGVTPEPDDTATNAAVNSEHQNPVPDKQPVASTDKAGRWVINIASSRSKADANRLAKKALSRDIHTKQQQVTVNGKQYWRVQITGFSTAAAARASAGAVKEKLGLKDVWITTRQEN